MSGRNFKAFIHSAFSKYVCSAPAEARATIGQFSMSGIITSCPIGARIPAALHRRPTLVVGPGPGGGT